MESPETSTQLTLTQGQNESVIQKKKQKQKKRNYKRVFWKLPCHWWLYHVELVKQDPTEELQILQNISCAFFVAEDE